MELQRDGQRRWYAARLSSFFLRGSSSRLDAASLLAGWKRGSQFQGGGQDFFANFEAKNRQITVLEK
jgi:hypothetical protein